MGEDNVLDTVKPFLILFHLEKTLLSKWERDTTKIVTNTERKLLRVNICFPSSLGTAIEMEILVQLLKWGIRFWSSS